MGDDITEKHGELRQSWYFGRTTWITVIVDVAFEKLQLAKVDGTYIRHPRGLLRLFVLFVLTKAHWVYGYRSWNTQREMVERASWAL